MSAIATAIFVSAAVGVAASVSSSRSAKKKRQLMEEQMRQENERLEAQERELDEISAKAKRAGIRSRRSRARRIGRASTIMAGQNQSNFQRLAESRKKLLGSGA